MRTAKFCTRCGTVRPLSDFDKTHPDFPTRDGYRILCKRHQPLVRYALDKSKPGRVLIPVTQPEPPRFRWRFKPSILRGIAAAERFRKLVYEYTPSVRRKNLKALTKRLVVTDRIAIRKARRKATKVS